MTDADFIRAIAFNSSLNPIPEVRAHHLRLIAIAEKLSEADAHPPTRHCMCTECAPSFESPDSGSLENRE